MSAPLLPLALAALVVAAPLAHADGGSRHGGRRAPPPPPSSPSSSQPAWVGRAPSRAPAATTFRHGSSDGGLAARRPAGVLGGAPAAAPPVAAPAAPAFRSSPPGGDTGHGGFARSHQAGTRLGAPTGGTRPSVPTTRPLPGTAPSPRRDSAASSPWMAPGTRPSLPSTWVSGRDRLRVAGAAAAHGHAGVRHGSLPSHGGGVYYGGRRHAHYPSPVFAPTWGYHRPWYPTFSFVSVWGYGCGCEPAPYYAEPLYPAPVYSAPLYSAPLYSAPLSTAPGYGAPSYVEPAPAAPQPEEAPQTPQAAPEGPSAEQQQVLARSLETFRAGRYAEALVLLEGAVAADPRLGDAWLGIAYAGLALERYDRTAAALEQAALLGAFPRGYRFDARPLFPDAAAHDAARARLEARVAMAPRDADARLVLAWLQVSAGERAAAQTQIQQVLALRPGDETAPVLAVALLPAPPQQAQQPGASR